MMPACCTSVEIGETEKGKTHRSSSDLLMKPLIHQVAGHRAENGKSLFALVHGPGGRVLKPLQDHDRGERELWFYTTVCTVSNPSPSLRQLRQFLPEFHGVSRPNGSEVSYLELSDLTAGYKRPCIVDIKMGALLYGPEKVSTDRARIEKKYPLAKHIGYQILGMKTYCPLTGETTFHDKTYFRNALTMDNVIRGGIGLYFQCRHHLRRTLVISILNQLRKIKHWFDWQKSFVFYSTSLLIIYEGSADDALGLGHDTSYKQHETSCYCGHDRSCQRHDTVREGLDTSSLKHDTSCEGQAKYEKASEHCVSNGNDTEKMEKWTETCNRDTNSGTKKKKANDKENEYEEIPAKEIEHVGSAKESLDNGACEDISEDSGILVKETDRTEICSSEDKACVENSSPSTIILPEGLAKTNIHMIDFAHVFPSQCIDKNYLIGLDNLIAHFETLL